MGNYNEALSTIVRQVESGQTSPETGRRGLEQRLIETIWRLMASMWGHKFVSSYGAEPDPDRVWAATLAGCTEAQIQAGLKACSTSGAEWPPSAPEFREMCMNPSGVPWETRGIMQADRERAMLPAPANRSRDAGRRALANLHALMNNTSNGPDAAA